LGHFRGNTATHKNECRLISRKIVLQTEKSCTGSEAKLQTVDALRKAPGQKYPISGSQLRGARCTIAGAIRILCGAFRMSSTKNSLTHVPNQLSAKNKWHTSVDPSAQSNVNVRIPTTSWPRDVLALSQSCPAALRIFVVSGCPGADYAPRGAKPRRRLTILSQSYRIKFTTYS